MARSSFRGRFEWQPFRIKIGRMKKSKNAKSVAVHPDHTTSLNRVRRIKGQVEGIERMIEDRRYCPDILTQIQAANSALRSLAMNILHGHLLHCVKEAMEARNEQEKDRKIAELLEIFRKNA